MANASTAEEAERRIGIVMGIQSHNKTGVNKEYVDRSLQGEATIAAAQTAKQQDAALRRERAGLDPNKDKGRIEEIDKQIAQSAKNLAEKTDAAALTLRNNLNAASQQLEQTFKKLAEQQSQAFNQRLDFVGSLKGQQILPSTVLDNIKALRAAEASGDKEAMLTATQRLADNKKSLNAAFGPEVFEGILAAGGMTPESQERLTQGMVEMGIRQGVAADKNLSPEEVENVVQNILKKQQESEPDMDTSKADIANLTQEIERTEIGLAEFGKAFNAEGINTAIAKIGESLDAFAKGALDATQILSSFQTINTKAESIIRENNKRMDALATEIGTLQTDLKSNKAKLDVLSEKINRK